MTPKDYLDLLRRAAESDYGLRVTVPRDPDEPTLFRLDTARRIRRKLYRARDQTRQQGDRSLDLLSMLVRYPGEILIVRRDKLPGMVDDDGDDGYQAETSPLSPGQLPLQVHARGPSPRRFLPFP